MTLSPPGVTTTPSPSTWVRTTRPRPPVWPWPSPGAKPPHHLCRNQPLKNFLLLLARLATGTFAIILTTASSFYPVRWAVSRSRPTVVLPRAITTLRPGATTTPSLQTSRSTIRVCSTKPNQTHNHPSILQLLNLYLQTKRLELLSQWFCYKNTSVSVINTHKSHEGDKFDMIGNWQLLGTIRGDAELVLLGRD